MLSLVSKLRFGLFNTTKKIFGAIGGIFKSKILSIKDIEIIEEALYLADFGVETTEEIIEEIQEAYKKSGPELKGSDISSIAKKVLQDTLQGSEPKDISQATSNLEVICLIGVNGAGKTTTAAKLAYAYQQKGTKVLLGACDTFRAAANEQLQSWGKRLDLDIIGSQSGGDSAAVAFDAYSAAKARACDLLILDTAGRLHTKGHLLDELNKVKRVLAKHDSNAPQHRWLVIDGSLGSNSIEQARTFHKSFGLTGLIITKLDGTSRGGALVAIYRELKIPIFFIGLGEAPEDLQPFSSDEYIDAIIDQ